MKLTRKLERLLMVIGLLLITIFVAAQVYRATMSRAELGRFRDLRVERVKEAANNVPSSNGLKFDFSLWSSQRIAAYEHSLAEHVDAPLAILRIAKVNLEVPVLDGTDELSLTRGVGHIGGTVRPGEEGNIGIAGHRDGFFRVLKDVVPGDIVELQGRSGTDIYRVSRIVIVRPNDVSVLQPKPTRSLTLVTCYPFYFIGSAPERYIVEASIANSGADESSPASQSSSQNLNSKQGQSTKSVRFTSAPQNANPQSRKLNKEKTR
jgi:sortase A